MPDEQLGALPATAAGAPQGDPAAGTGGSVQGAGDSQPQGRRQYTDEEIDQLVDFSNRAYDQLQALEPHADTIRRIQADENYRNFVGSATSTYDLQRQEQERARGQEIPEWARPIANFVQEQQAAQVRTAQQSEAQFFAEQRAVADRLRRENSLSDAQVTDLAHYADTLASRHGRRVGIEEAYNHVKGFGGGAPSGAPPTVGLRGDASAPGVPSSSQNSQAFVNDFHGATLALLKGANR